MLEILTFILIGFITGISIGVVGIGAGIMLMPMLIASGMSIQSAVACGLALQLVPQSLPGLYLYHKKGHFELLTSLYIIIGSLLGVTLGAYLVNSGYINEQMMYDLLFTMLIASTIYIGYNFVFQRDVRS